MHEGNFDGRKVTYTLADQGVSLLKGKLRLRQVTRLSEDGHQTPILTSRRDLSALEVAYRMFERWRQENFFKYLREQYALDALVDYRVEPDRDSRDVPNPERAAVDAKLREARAEVARLKAEYGDRAFENIERARPTMRGFKIGERKIGEAIRVAMKRVVTLENKRARMPLRVPVKEVAPEIVKLAPERKHLTNLIKMVAYQAESDLVRLIATHYRRAEDEGRKLIQSVLASAADLDVSELELRVRLVPLSSAHRKRALVALCEELNATQTVFPPVKALPEVLGQVPQSGHIPRTVGQEIWIQHRQLAHGYGLDVDEPFDTLAAEQDLRIGALERLDRHRRKLTTRVRIVKR